MTLFREIERLLERTYSSTDLQLEQCLIGTSRCYDLSRQAGRSAENLSNRGRIFLRPGGENLRLAIFYAPDLIHELEQNDPRRALNERNIGALITFIEEIAHGVQVALLFLAGERHFESEDFACNLEAQAKVDTYLVLAKLSRLLAGRRVPLRVKRWLESQLFDESYANFHSLQLRNRYGKAQRVAKAFLEYLKTVPLKKRQSALCQFRTSSWQEKVEFLAAKQ